MVRRIAEFSSKQATIEPDFSLASTTLDELNDRALEILRREVTNLMIESTGKKLSPTSSAALVQYVKLLQELKETEDKTLKALGNEHLEKLAKNDKS